MCPDRDFGEDIERAARIAHEVNRAYCHALGDTSHLPWDAAPEWQRESAMNGVKHILANPDTTPEQSHKSWLKEKVLGGWVYGEVKDLEALTHPCMVPYDQLPLEQRVKDHLFGAAVRSALFKG